MHKLIKKMVLTSLAIGIIITLLIWIFRDFLGWKISLFLFNLISLMGAPGDLITLVVVSIFSTQHGWQAMHGVTPYKYISYAANFLFYFFLVFLIQFLITKFKRNH